MELLGGGRDLTTHSYSNMFTARKRTDLRGVASRVGGVHCSYRSRLELWRWREVSGKHGH